MADFKVSSFSYCINILHFFKRRILTTFFADSLTKFGIYEGSRVTLRNVSASNLSVQT